MNILLIAPSIPEYKRNMPYIFPIGMAYISAALKQAGHTVECVNSFHLYCSLEEKLAELAGKKQFDLIGVGGLSPMYHVIKNVMRTAKAAFPRAATVLGGNIVSTMPEAILRDMQVDFGSIGEGEASVAELASALESGGDLRQIPGLAIHDAATGEVLMTAHRHGAEDLDTLPFPDYEGFEFKEYLDRSVPYADRYGWNIMDKPRTLTLVASRSCPFQCTFCYHFPGEKYRQRSVENCIAEMDYAIDKFGINSVQILDEIFFTKANMERLRAFCDYFKKRGLLWTCQTKVTEANREALELMRESGCLTIGYGIEHVDDNVLRNMRKGITREQIENALSLTYEIGFNVNGNLLFGDPAETVESFMEVVAWWMRNRKYTLSLVPVWVLPNSALYLKARKEGLIKDEIQFLATDHLQNFEINLTRMSETEFNALKRRIRCLNGTMGQYVGQVENVGEDGLDSYGRMRYNIDSWCPHCGKKNSHKRIFFPNAKELQTWDSNYFLTCMDCHRQFNVPNPSAWCEEPSLPRRVFLTAFPTWRLFQLYFARGGSLAELAQTSAPQS